MNNQIKDHTQNIKLYNVKILKIYDAYLREELGWSDSQINNLFQMSGSDSSVVDFDDNWFDQKLADDFHDNIVTLTGDHDIAYKVGSYLSHQSARGIAGRVITSFLSPAAAYRNVTQVSEYYSKGATLIAENVTNNTAIIKSVPVPGCHEKPYQCRNRIGMLEPIPKLFNLPKAVITHNKCIHKGDECCEYKIVWVEKAYRYALPLSLLVFITLFASFQIYSSDSLFSFLVAAGLSIAAYSLLDRMSYKRITHALDEQIVALKISHDTIERRHKELSFVTEIHSLVGRTMPVNLLCNVLVYAIHNMMGYDRVSIYLYDNINDSLHAAANIGYSVKDTEYLSNTKLRFNSKGTDSFLEEIIYSGDPLFVRDVDNDNWHSTLKSQELIKILNIKSFIAIPICFEKTIYGIILVDNFLENILLTENDRDLLISVAKPISVGFSNADAYEKLKKSNIELEMLVHERTKELATAKDEADRANNAKSIFLANMSHELRSPLIGVTTVGELLEDTILDEKQKEYTNVILNSSNLLLSIINNIIDYSKIESNIIDVDHNPFNIRDVLLTVTTILKPITKKKGIDFNLFVSDSIPEIVSGDKIKLTQIIMNLCNNAVKFTSTGYIHLLAYPTIIDLNSKILTIHIEVVDTGIGINEQKLDSIFERFNQADKSIVRRFGGSGLGINISNKFAEHMGGKIGVGSIEDVGTRFWVELPFGINVDSFEKEHSKPAMYKQQTICIISKNKEAVSKLTKKLKKWKYTVNIESDLQSVIEYDKELVTLLPFAIIIDSEYILSASNYIETLPIDIRNSLNIILLYRNDQISTPKIGYQSKITLPINNRMLIDSINAQCTHAQNTVNKNTQNYPSSINKNIREGMLSVLICDDEDTNRYVLKEILEKYGHTVKVTKRAEEALELLKNGEVDAAIIDYVMPDINGLELAKLYHKYKDKNRIPLILATSSMPADIKEECSAFFDYYIEKPVSVTTLCNIINDLCNNSYKRNNKLIEYHNTISSTDDYEKHMIDRKILAKCFLPSGDKKTKLETLISIYKESFEYKITLMSSAIEASDYVKFKMLIHSIKSGTYTIGAIKLYQKMVKIEKMTDETLKSQKNSIVKELTDLFCESINELNTVTL